MDSKIAQIYGDRVRLRVCGMCWRDDKLLMVNHKGLTHGAFWAPPGGGIEFGEPLENALKREFLEETGLQIRVGRFLFGCEYIDAPLHSIELFYEVYYNAGDLITGSDPEVQMIEDVRYMHPEEIGRMSKDQLHGIFTIARTTDEFNKLSGFYRI